MRISAAPGQGVLVFVLEDDRNVEGLLPGKHGLTRVIGIWNRQTLHQPVVGPRVQDTLVKFRPKTTRIGRRSALLV